MNKLLWLLTQALLAGMGSFSFGLIFGVPIRHYFACGINGAVAWVVYLFCLQLQASIVVASLVASIPLTILARIFSVKQKAPSTLFLFCGIFPLVPGAGIYYTAYHFMNGNNVMFVNRGVETLKIAIALAIGISMVLAIPPRQKQR